MKNLKNVVALILILTAIMSCKKDEEERMVGYYVDMGFYISIKSNLGEDLLDPNNPNSYKSDDIKILYLRDGKMQEVFNSAMDFPRNFRIDEYDDGYKMLVFLDDSETNTKTFVKWNATEIDEIEVEVVREDTYTGYTKTKFNGQSICADNMKDCKLYEIIK